MKTRGTFSRIDEPCTVDTWWHHDYRRAPVPRHVVDAGTNHCFLCGRTYKPGASPALEPVLPTDAAARNAIPMCTGVLDYFALALAEIAKLSKVANEQHNPGQPMHWAVGKSTDHADKILKHLTDRGLLDTDGMRHSAKVAWRALAMLTEELVAAGGKHARNAY